MAIPLSCDCGKTYRLRDELGGQRVKCPNCKRIHDLPVVDSEVAPEKYEIIDDHRPQPSSSQAVKAMGNFASRPPVPVVQPTEDDERPAPRRKRRRRSRESSGYSGISISPGVIAGVALQLGQDT